MRMTRIELIYADFNSFFDLNIRVNPLTYDLIRVQLPLLFFVPALPAPVNKNFHFPARGHYETC